MWLARLSVRNTILVNLVTMTVLVLGTYAYIALPRELSPEFKFNWVFITATYTGAAPEEVEQLITKPIEDIDQIDLITSTSSESVAFISVKFEQDLSDDEFDKRFQELQTELNSVALPEAAEDPEVMQLDTNSWQPVVGVVVTGGVSEAERKTIAENLEDLIG